MTDKPPLSDKTMAFALDAIRTEVADLAKGFQRRYHRLHAAAEKVLAEAMRVQAELEQACADRDRYRAQVEAVAEIRCWVNEDGKRFLFADDVRAALGLTTAAPACACRAETVHRNGCEDGQ